jgi:hypothetical protein
LKIWWDVFRLTSSLSLPPVKKARVIALKAAKKKSRVSSDEDSDEEEDAIALLAKNFERLMKNPRFKKKFSDRLKGKPKGAEPEEEKKDLKGPQCYVCSGFGHVKIDYGNLKMVKGKAYNATLSDDSEEETPDKGQKFIAFVASQEDSEGHQSYYSRSSDDMKEFKEAYKILCVKFLNLRETHQLHI